MHWRAVRAFLLGPLIGTAACSLFGFLLFNNNALLFVYMIEGALVGTYAAAWIVGLPLYVLLIALGHMRPRYFVYVFSLAGLLIWLFIFWGHFNWKGAAPLFVLCCVSGFATGAAFAGLLEPPMKGQAS